MSSRKRRNIKVGRTVPMVSLRKNTCGLCRAKTRRPYVHTKKSHGTAPDFVNVYNEEEEEEALDEADELFEDLEEPDATPSSSAKRAPSRLSREHGPVLARIKQALRNLQRVDKVATDTAKGYGKMLDLMYNERDKKKQVQWAERMKHCVDDGWSDKKIVETFRTVLGV